MPAGEPLDLNELMRQLERLRGLHYFGRISYDLSAVGDVSRLEIDIARQRTGRANMQFGGSLRSDFSGDSTYALLARHQWLAINRRAAEWVNTAQVGEKSLLRSEFLQPLDWGLRWYVKPMIDLERELQSIWLDGVRVTEYKIRDSEVSVALGRWLGNWGDVHASVFHGREKGEVQIGLSEYPSFDDRAGDVRLGFDIDTRDAPIFPRRGSDLRVLVERNMETLGSSRSWTVVDLKWLQFFSAGRSTISPRVQVRSNLQGGATFASAAFMGGFQRLSGLEDDEIAGDHGGVIALDYYYRCMDLDLGALSSRLFAGLTLEAGNTYYEGDTIDWDSLRRGGSIYLGVASPLGPISFGGGWTDHDRTRLYLILGARY